MRPGPALRTCWREAGADLPRPPTAHGRAACHPPFPLMFIVTSPLSSGPRALPLGGQGLLLPRGWLRPAGGSCRRCWPVGTRVSWPSLSLKPRFPADWRQPCSQGLPILFVQSEQKGFSFFAPYQMAAWSNWCQAGAKDRDVSYAANQCHSAKFYTNDGAFSCIFQGTEGRTCPWSVFLSAYNILFSL